MGFSKTKEDLLLRTISLSGVPSNVTEKEVILSLQKNFSDCGLVLAGCLCPNPSESTGLTCLVLFGDHNGAKRFIHCSEVTLDFGKGPVKLDVGTAIECQIPDDWLDKSDGFQTHTKMIYPTAPFDANMTLGWGAPPPYNGNPPNPGTDTGKDKHAPGQPVWLPHGYPPGYPYPQYPPPQHMQQGLTQQQYPGYQPQLQHWFRGHPMYQQGQPYAFPPTGGTQEDGSLPSTYPGPGYPHPNTEAMEMEEEKGAEEYNRKIFKDQEEIYEKLKKKGEMMNDPQSSEEEEEEEKSKTTMIKVSGLSDRVTEDLLINYFENKRKNGGGDIQAVDFDKKSKSAVITFEESEAVERVMQKCPHLLDSKQIEVEEYFVLDEEPGSVIVSNPEKTVGAFIIKVENIRPSCSTDTLQFYFENTKRSGGGDIKNIDFKEGGVALITFEEESAIEGVMKQEHKVEGCKLFVSVYIPPKPRPTYKDKLLIKGLNVETTKDCLCNFLEAKGHVSTTDVMYDEEREKAIITFEKEPDFEKLQTACRTKTLEQAHLTISKVPVSNCIKVTGISEKTTKDTLTFYFENQRHGGGELENIVFEREEDYCLVYFQEASVVDSVLVRSHKIDGCTLHLKMFHDCLGAGSEEQKFKLPAPLKVSDQDPTIIEFLKQSKSHKEALEIQLKQCHGTIEWPSKQGESIVLHCVLTKNMKDWNKVMKNWGESIRKSLLEFLEKFSVKNFTVLQELWRTVLSALGSISVPNPNGVAVITDMKSSKISVCGIKGIAKDVADQIEKVIKDVEADFERKKQQIKEVMKSLKPFQLKMIVALKMNKDLEKKYKGMKMKVNVSKKEIVFEGISNDVKAAQLEIFEKVTKIVSSKPPNMSQRKLAFMDSREVKDYLVNQLLTSGIVGVWNIENKNVIVYAMTDSDAVKAAHVLKDSIIECPVDIEEESVPILSLPSWQQTITNEEQMYPGRVKIYPEVDQLKIFILSTDDLASKILEIVSDFLKFNTIKKLSLHFQTGILRYLRNYHERDIQDIEEKLQPLQVQMRVTDSGIDIKGTEDGLQQAKFKLDQLVEPVVKRTHILNQPGIPKFIQSEKGQDRLKTIEHTNKCIIDVSGSSDDEMNDEDEGFEIIQPSSVAISGQKIHAVCSPQTGISIYALEGDMTELVVDVIVNAANPELEHSGGLAKALVDKGGKIIQDECREYVRKNKKLLDGGIFRSSAGKLKCKAVVHAVGPRWQGGDNLEKDSLGTAVYRALCESNDNHYKSIALPALSAGVYGFPSRLCAQVIVGAIKDYLADNNPSSVMEIYLCDVKNNTVFNFKEALVKVFGSQTVTLGQSGSHFSKPQIQPNPSKRSKYHRGVSFEDQEPSHTGSARSFGNVEVKVEKGELAKQKTDVIVNTTSKDLNLSSGAVSKSLLTVAGPQLQQECQQNYPSGIAPGQVAETSGYNLNCQKVLHGSLPGWDSGGSSVQALVDFMKSCLKTTVDNGLTSISFPALGTGNLGYPRDVVAREMFNFVSKFVSKNSGSSLQKVKFVVYPGDTATVKAFEMEEKGGTGGAGSAEGAVGGKRQGRTFGSQESGSGDSWAGHQRSSEEKSLKICDVLVKIFDGDITESKADCIVNGSNRELDLRQGAVSQAILKKAGQDLEKDCSLRRQEMKKKGVAITTAGKLPCSYIMHLAAPGDNANSPSAWKKVIKISLSEADDSSIKKIAFPLLGQSYQMSVEDSAKALTEAVFDFAQSKPTSVSEIHVVIFQKKHVVAYNDAVKKTLVHLSKHKKGLWNWITDKFSVGSSRPDGQSSAKEYEETEVTLTIFAKSQMEIDSTIKRIETMCDSEVMDKIMRDEIIRELSPYQVSKIRQLCVEYRVRIEIETKLGRIRIQGIADDVLNTIDEIHKIIRDVDRSKQQASEAELLGKVVQWYCIDQGQSGQALVDYEKMVNLTIENAYKKNLKSVQICDSKGKTYVVDFGNMEEYDQQNPSDKVKIIRRDLIKDTSFESPAHWAPMTQNENLKVVNLAATDPEYLKVYAEIAPLGRKIIKIERIQNRTLYMQYTAKKKLLEQNAPKQVERYLWHGTSAETVDSINAHGFNRSYCGKNATAYGDGVYFAVNPTYSASNTYSRPDANGYKRCYYACVLTGEFTQGRQGMRVPPPKNQAALHILYDSVTDNISTPGMFIIFNDTQAYPEYLVTF